MNSSKSLILTAICIAGLMASTSAQTLYAATGGGSAADLVTLNPSTGAVATNIGNTGVSITGLAFDSSGVLWSAGGRAGPSAMSLHTIDTATGAPTFIRALGHPFADISFDGSGQLYGWSENSDALFRIGNPGNPAAGSVTQVGSSIGFTRRSGMAFHRTNGQLWFCGRSVSQLLDRLDPSTGQVAQSVNLSRAGEYNAADWNCSSDTFFASESTFSAARNLVTINVSTGQVNTIGASLNNMDALAWDCSGGGPGGPAVPATSTTSLIVTAILLAGVLTLYLGKQPS